MDRPDLLAKLKSIDRQYVWFGRTNGYGSKCTLWLIDGIGVLYAGSMGGGDSIRCVTEDDIEISNSIERLYPDIYGKYINGLEIDWEVEEDDEAWDSKIDESDFTYYVSVREKNPNPGEYYYGSDGFNSRSDYYWYPVNEGINLDDRCPWEDLNDAELVEWYGNYERIINGKNSWYDK